MGGPLIQVPEMKHGILPGQLFKCVNLSRFRRNDPGKLNNL